MNGIVNFDMQFGRLVKHLQNVLCSLMTIYFLFHFFTFSFVCNRPQSPANDRWPWTIRLQAGGVYKEVATGLLKKIIIYLKKKNYVLLILDRVMKS
jgi:hypothetical protein